MNVSDLIHNYVLNCAVLSWGIAQVMKTLLVLITTKKFCIERMVGSGGMPSAHSACVCSLAIGTCRSAGFASVEFAIAFVLASVVMYDAMNVRRQAGEHAKAINNIVDVIDEADGDEDLLDIDQLKESLGHKPMEVLAGALLGILIALILPM